MDKAKMKKNFKTNAMNFGKGIVKGIETMQKAQEDRQKRQISSQKRELERLRLMRQMENERNKIVRARRGEILPTTTRKRKKKKRKIKRVEYY